MLIIGNEEVASSTVTVRLRDGQNLKAQPLLEFKAMVKSAVESKGTV